MRDALAIVGVVPFRDVGVLRGLGLASLQALGQSHLEAGRLTVSRRRLTVTGLEVRLAEGLQACHPKAPQHPSTSKGKQLLDEIENRHNQLLNILMPLNFRVSKYALWSLVYLKAVWGEFSGAAVWF